MFEAGRVYKTNPTAQHLEYRRAIPVSRQAARDAFLAVQCDPQGLSMGDWYVWYISLEMGATLFNQRYAWIKFSKTVLSKQYSARFPISKKLIAHQKIFRVALQVSFANCPRVKGLLQCLPNGLPPQKRA